MSADPSAHRRGLALLALVVLSWGLVWPVNKAILASMSPLWLASIRSIIAAAALFAISLPGRRLVLPRQSDLPVLLSIALLHMVGFTLLASIGLQYVPAGRSVVLAYTTPLWVTPGAALFLGERLSARQAIGVMLGIAGLAVLFNPLAIDWQDRGALFGNAVILAGAVLWAVSILHIRGHAWRSTPFQLVPWEMALAALILTVLAFAMEGDARIAWTGGLAGLMLFTALPGTAIGYWAAAAAGRNLPAVTMSVGLLGAPVVGVVAAALMLGEVPGADVLAALALIIGGVALGTTGRALARGA